MTLEENHWIGVDLDGTLAEYTVWKGFEDIGKIIPTMADRIKIWLKQGKMVKIFTARASGGEQAISYIQNWMLKNGLPVLEITNVKDHNMIELWDDLCVSVETNTGKIIKRY